MVRPATTKATIKKNTIRDMQSLGVYRKEYDPLIETYADIFEEYYRVMKEFEKAGYKLETETAAGNPKKSPYVATLENLRKDIITYSDRLCLSPKANQESSSDKPKESKLAEALKFIG